MKDNGEILLSSLKKIRDFLCNSCCIPKKELAENYFKTYEILELIRKFENREDVKVSPFFDEFFERYIKKNPECLLDLDEETLVLAFKISKEEINEYDKTFSSINGGSFDYEFSRKLKRHLLLLQPKTSESLCFLYHLLNAKNIGEQNTSTFYKNFKDALKHKYLTDLIDYATYTERGAGDKEIRALDGKAFEIMIKNQKLFKFFVEKTKKDNYHRDWRYFYTGSISSLCVNPKFYEFFSNPPVDLCNQMIHPEKWLLKAILVCDQIHKTFSSDKSLELINKLVEKQFFKEQILDTTLDGLSDIQGDAHGNSELQELLYVNFIRNIDFLSDKTKTDGSGDFRNKIMLFLFKVIQDLISNKKIDFYNTSKTFNKILGEGQELVEFTNIDKNKVELFSAEILHYKKPPRPSIFTIDSENPVNDSLEKLLHLAKQLITLQEYGVEVAKIRSHLHLLMSEKLELTQEIADALKKSKKEEEIKVVLLTALNQVSPLSNLGKDSCNKNIRPYYPLGNSNRSGYEPPFKKKKGLGHPRNV